MHGLPDLVQLRQSARAGSIRPSLLGRTAVLLALACGAVIFAPAAPADTLFLVQGGRLEGRLLNPTEEPRRRYIFQTDAGVKLALEADMVDKVVQSTPEELRYQALLPKMTDTAVDHWKMAEWCRSVELHDQRQFHLREVLRHDGDHAEARRALGYRQIEGRWVQPDDLMREQGLVKDAGRWRLPQDIEMEKLREQRELAEKQWRAQVKTWRSRIERRNDQQLVQQIAQIDDPAAAPALAELLDGEEQLELRRVYIDVLGRLRTGVATKALIHTAINNHDDLTRDAALGQLENYATKSAAEIFRSALKSDNRRHILNAAIGLRRMGETEVIPSLIVALVTEHRVLVQPGSNGRIAPTFGNGGSGGLSVGAKPKYVDRKMQNREVLDALLALVDDSVNYQFDQAAWRQWYSQKMAPPPQLSLRRSP